ncbi:MAG: hypothetical protein LBK03_07205, partial [Bacteroidales bacterium]|nr:hypothetical protein [Bacteroidales bacterium]
MKKNYFLILTFWAFGLSVLAQSEGYYYWYKGEQIPLVLNLSTVNIVTTPQFQAGVLSRMGFDVISELNDNAGLQPLKVVQAVFSIASDRTSYNRSVAGLRNLDGVVS